jgi:hypothetical protein
MTLTAEDIAEAKDAIREEGVRVLFEQVASTPIDATKPWLGTTDVPTEYQAWIAFVDQATAAAMITDWKKDADYSSSTRFGIMGNHGFEPQVGNRVKRAGKEDLVVKDVMASAPADIPVFYVLEFNA